MILNVILFTINIVWVLLLYFEMKREGGVKYLNWRWRTYFPIAIALVIVIVIYSAVCIYYSIKDNPLTKSQITDMIGSCISFVGTFGLGYFIYRKGEDNRINDLALECEKLICAVKTTQDVMYRIVNCGYKPKKIEYDINWPSYYLKVQYIEGEKNIELGNTINRYFMFVDEMNTLIYERDYEKAISLYYNKKKKEEYSISKYNIDEAVRHIEYKCVEIQDGIPLRYETLLENKEVLTVVHNCANKYYSIVENKIYNYLIQNSLNRIDSLDIEEDLVEWLLQGTEFSQDIGSYLDKRLVVKMLLECFMMMKKKSSRLDYFWGEIWLRNHN
mgnify:CR=1 FL=1|jgi:hypothetical protein